jgi:hypothetical protein
VVPGVHQTDAVGADECSTVALGSVEDALFEFGTRGSLFTEARTEYDESLGLLVARQQFHRVGACCGRNGQYGQFGGRQERHVLEGWQALYLSFFGVDRMELTAVTSAGQVAQNGASGFVYIVGSTHYGDASGVEQFFIYHGRLMILAGSSNYRLWCWTLKAPNHRPCKFIGKICISKIFSKLFRR